jgi:hypothetical protein
MTAPHAPADVRRVALVQRLAELGGEIQIVAAELQALDAGLRGEAADAGPTDDEMVSITEIAKAMRTTKDAARKQLKRAGVGVRIAGRLYAPRAALAGLYVRNGLSNVAFVPSLRTPD